MRHSLPTRRAGTAPAARWRRIVRSDIRRYAAASFGVRYSSSSLGMSSRPSALPSSDHYWLCTIPYGARASESHRIFWHLLSSYCRFDIVCHLV